VSDFLQFRRAGCTGVLIELPDLDTTLAMFEAIVAAVFEGIEEIIPGARTLLVRFDPLVISHDDLVRLISGVELDRRAQSVGQLIEIPVIYDGEDLEFVASHLGWTVEELIRRHSAATFTVAFYGLAPGFG
jgi:allophanate hydrolase subunit 1